LCEAQEVQEMPDQWIEISSDERHRTFVMPVPGGALVRQIEHEDGATVAVSVCFISSSSGDPLQPSQFPATEVPAEATDFSSFFVESTNEQG
jgi:hypothetical protein